MKIGSDYSGAGAFDQALNRLGINYKTVFACDMDKYARKTYVANYGEPDYYPENVYDREIPKEPLDIYMTSPPCQGFSIAGLRKGSILFLNSHELIQKNKPRYFIFENVKGLLSHDKKNKTDEFGRTFNEWINMLGGKSVNGNPVIFPYENSVPYHIYWKVINAKHHGVPQNRERVFIIGIRDDADNNFIFPPKEHLSKRLKDVLENEVDEKYFLSDKMVEKLTFNGKKNGIIGDLNKEGQKGEVFSDNSAYISCLTATDYKQPKQIAVNSATKKGFETAKEGDSINFERPNSKTRKGRVGKQVAQTIDTKCHQGVCIPVLTPDRINKRQNGRRFKENGDPSFTITTQDRHDIYDGFKIRRLTPLECFRLMDFPDSFVENARKAGISDTQLYKQAGNSIMVAVLVKIIERLKL